MSPSERVMALEAQLAHVWTVRTFLKHAPEAEDDEELQEVFRTLYDYSLALGPSLQAGDADGYLKQARKKLSRLKGAAADFTRLQPEISTHTNFQMASASLNAALREIERLLAGAAVANESGPVTD